MYYTDYNAYKMEAAFADMQLQLNVLMQQNNKLRGQIGRLDAGQVNGQQAATANSQTIANLTGIQASELQRLGKPGVYNNNDDDWLEWNEKLLAYVGLIDVNVKIRMKAIASNPQDDSLTVLSTDDERAIKWAQVIKHMLLMVTVKRGNLAVRRAKDDNGFESYRLLAKQHVTSKTTSRAQTCCWRLCGFTSARRSRMSTRTWNSGIC